MLYRKSVISLLSAEIKFEDLEPLVEGKTLICFVSGHTVSVSRQGDLLLAMLTEKITKKVYYYAVGFHELSYPKRAFFL